MNVELHILNAHGRLTPYLRAIESAFHSSVERVKALMPVCGIDVVVCVEPTYVIPALGLGGYSPAADRVFLPTDPANKRFAESLETEFLPALGHELHHCMRRGTVGFGHTLGEALVTEGLACHFETELRNGKIPVYASALQKDDIARLMARAQEEFDNADYNYQEWFFGEGENIPFYAGYTLGFALVSRYIDKHSVKASRLYAEPAESFYAEA